MRPNHVKAARALLDWDQQTLADKSGLSIATIGRMEQGVGEPEHSSVIKLISAFSAAGLQVFFEDNHGGVGVRFKVDLRARLQKFLNPEPEEEP